MYTEISITVLYTFIGNSSVDSDLRFLCFSVNSVLHFNHLSAT